jgi:hypothetical protein
MVTQPLVQSPIPVRHSILFSLSLLAANIAAAQNQPVRVQDDPMHKIIFENTVVRVIDVQVQPGATTLYHRHVIPSIIVYLTRSTNRSESWPDKEILTRDITPGQSRYAPYDEKPLAHRVTNTGAGLFRVFDIELLYKPATGPALPPLVEGLKQHWDEKLARSSTIRLEPNAVLTIPANRCSLLVVGIAGTLQVKPDEARPSPLSPGNYKFFGPHTQLQVSAGAGAAEAVLLELKR